MEDFVKIEKIGEGKCIVLDGSCGDHTHFSIKLQHIRVYVCVRACVFARP